MGPTPITYLSLAIEGYNSSSSGVPYLNSDSLVNALTLEILVSLRSLVIPTGIILVKLRFLVIDSKCFSKCFLLLKYCLVSQSIGESSLFSSSYSVSSMCSVLTLAFFLLVSLR